MKSKTSPLDHLVGELKNQCNKYANGSCQTLACLKRGGYKRGEKSNYEEATCERHEQVKALEALEHFRSYLQTCADEHETNDMKG